VAEITVTVSKDGSDVVMDAEGFVGTGCSDFRKNIIAALGTISRDEKKPEYYATQSGGISLGSK